MLIQPPPQKLHIHHMIVGSQHEQINFTWQDEGMIEPQQTSRDLTTSLRTTIKELAWTKPTEPFEWIHISKAAFGEGVVYFEPWSGNEMHARRGPGRPHFYYKGQPTRERDDGLHLDERRQNEGIVHLLMKELIRERKYITVLINGSQERVTFSDVRVEHRINTPEGAWRIDLQCDINGPEHVKRLFQGTVNIEVWCHHKLPRQKIDWLCTQPVATIEIVVWRKALHQIEGEEAALLAAGEGIPHLKIQQWKNFLATTLDKPWSPKVLWIPNNNHWTRRNLGDDAPVLPSQAASSASIPSAALATQLMPLVLPLPPHAATASAETASETPSEALPHSATMTDPAANSHSSGLEKLGYLIRRALDYLGQRFR